MALHAGAAAALLIGQRRLIAEELRAVRRRAARSLLGLSFLPAAVVGYTLERPIERHLGGPRATAFGLLAGAAAMLVADTRPQLRGRGEAAPATGWRSGSPRRRRSPRASRATASPWRRPAGARFSRDQANLLSRTIALPIIVGATRAQGRPPRAAAAPLPSCAARWPRRRRLLRLDPRLPAPDPAGRARPGAVALCRLPGRPGGRGAWQARQVIQDLDKFIDLEFGYYSKSWMKFG